MHATPSNSFLAILSIVLLVAQLSGDEPHSDNPPGSHYGMTFQKIELLKDESSGKTRESK